MNQPRLIEFKTEDKLILPGLLYEAGTSDKIAINLHGNGSSSVFYDQEDGLDLPSELAGVGISLLRFNNRGAHIIKKLNIYSNKIKKDRKSYGCAYETIKECVFDINAALKFVKNLSYKEFYLIGKSTGANKVCVYDYYNLGSEFSKYVLICGGDDTGIYYDLLGDKLFYKLLSKSKKKIKNGDGDQISQELLKFEEIFSYKSFFDIANPDGDYNCFPFSEVLGRAKLSKKPLFRYFKNIKKPSLVVYGSKDEYCWGSVSKIVSWMKKLKPDFSYEIIKGADHGFNGKKEALAVVVANYLIST